LENGFKKKSNIKESQLKPLKDPFADRKPKGSLFDRPLPGIRICLNCNSRVSPGDMECPNCHSKNLDFVGVQPRMPDFKGKSFSPKNETPEYIQQGIPLTSSVKNTDFLFDSSSDHKIVEAKKPIKKKPEKEYKSEEFKMLSDPFDNDTEKSDKDIDEIVQTTQDLAIDG